MNAIPLLGGVVYLGLLPDFLGYAVTCCVLIAKPIVSFCLTPTHRPRAYPWALNRLLTALYLLYLCRLYSKHP